MAHAGEGEGPEDDPGTPRTQKASPARRPWTNGYCDPAQGGGEDGIADSCEELVGSRRREREGSRVAR